MVPIRNPHEGSTMSTDLTEAREALRGRAMREAVALLDGRNIVGANNGEYDRIIEALATAWIDGYREALVEVQGVVARTVGA